MDHKKSAHSTTINPLTHVRTSESTFESLPEGSGANVALGKGMKSVLKVCLIGGITLALGVLYWIQMETKTKKKTEEIRRVAIARNRALLAAQAGAMHDGPGRSLTGAESTKPTPTWTKASAAFLATEARFASTPETPPPPSNDVVNYASEWSPTKQNNVVEPAPTPTVPK
jgi:hypothetical protein